MGAKSHAGYRRPDTGRFTTRRYAENHPTTTQKESIPYPGRGDTGRGKRK